MTAKREVRVFLSSTYVDLSQTRAEVIKWLQGVFEADLTIMETFGSDAAPPDILSVRRVRDCDLFVGIYAHRYGTVDPTIGKSITELELDEAKQSLSTGTLKDILLYVIDEKSTWVLGHKDKSSAAEAGRKGLRHKAAEHTYTLFQTGADLPFFILRDVRRKLDQHFSTLPTRVRRFALPAPRRLNQPIGMEFLTSQFQRYLISRQDKVNELARRLGEEPTVLMLGESGVGKTSLIHAGLIPAIVNQGFRPVYSRPLGLPCSDIVQQLYSTIFGGAKSHRAELPAVVAEAEAALRGKTLLLIIDQFEDVLGSGQIEETKALVSSLTTLRNLSSPSVKTLIAYRADLEARLGEYWQAMSGSPSGLPRVYLGGLNPDRLWAEITRALRDLSVRLKLRAGEADHIVADLINASHGTGVQGTYPPYVQMLIGHLWKESRIGRSPLTYADYERAGGMSGIVGSYLSRQLAYAQDAQGHLKSVLVSLVRSYGVKAQKEIDEVQVDSGLTKPESEAALEKLIDLRLVRHIGSYYEVSHDFVARKIINELADSEEREFKRFRELLSSKAQAYATTRSSLTSDELLMLYKHRHRIIPEEPELRILLASWIQGAGPALFWLLQEPAPRLKDLIVGAQGGLELEADEQMRIALLKRKLGEEPFPSGDFSPFRGYKRSWELMRLMAIDSERVPEQALLYGLRHDREDVRDAALLIVGHRIGAGGLTWIQRLRESGSLPVLQAYFRLVLMAAPWPLDQQSPNRALVEFSALRALANASTASEVAERNRDLLRLRPPGRILIFSRALVLVKTGRLPELLRLCERLPKAKALLALEAIGHRTSLRDFTALLRVFCRWTRRPPDYFRLRRNYAKPLALADAIRRAMREDFLAVLRRSVGNLELRPPTRPIILAALEHGALQDLRTLVDRIATASEKVNIWNHTQLGYAAGALTARDPAGIPGFVVGFLCRKDFWGYLSAQERRAADRNDLLPLRNPDNRPFLVRLVAYALVGAAGKKDRQVLIRLCSHNYSLIAHAAALRLADLLGEQVLGVLGKEVDKSIRERTIQSLAEATAYAEMRVFNVI